MQTKRLTAAKREIILFPRSGCKECASRTNFVVLPSIRMTIMINRCFAIVAGLLLAGSCVQAHALVVTRRPTLDTGFGTAATLNTVSINVPLRTITIDVNVLRLGSPFNLGFNAAAPVGTLLSPSVGTYRVTVNMTNGILRPGVPTGRPINGFDINIGDPAGNPIIAFDTTTPPASDRFAVENPNIGSGFRFGGINGGGGEIYSGETAISSITLVGINTGAATNQNFTLSFVANPEPATLLLGAMLAVPGGVYFRRRRQSLKTVAVAE